MKTIDIKINIRTPLFRAILGTGLLVAALYTPARVFAETEYVFSKTPSFSDDFNADWNPGQNGWRVATWKQNGTQMSSERCRVDGKGMLVQTVLKGLPAQGGSMQTKQEFSYGRWIARVKPSAIAGVLNSIFTIDWDDLKTADSDQDGTKCEVDIEFLTYTFTPDGGTVHLAIHRKDKANIFVREAPLEFNPSDDFHDWGFDILPDRVRWHVDGKIIEEFVYPEPGFMVPNYEFYLNSWTRERWIHGPASEDAHYAIDWVKFFPLEQ